MRGLIFLPLTTNNECAMYYITFLTTALGATRRTMSLCPQAIAGLRGTSCTHRSKEVAVPASLTVVPLNPAMAWGHKDMARLVAPSSFVH